jgi:hypothetical protein
MLELDKDIINKMDTDELRNYLYQLQKYTITIKEVNCTRKESEDTLIRLLKTNDETFIRLLSLKEDLSTLALKVSDQGNRLAKLANEIEDKYISECIGSDIFEE